MDFSLILKLNTKSSFLRTERGRWFYRSIHNLLIKSDLSFTSGTNYVLTFKYPGRLYEDPLYQIEYTGNGTKEVSLNANMNILQIGSDYGNYSGILPLAIDLWDIDQSVSLGAGTIDLIGSVYSSEDVPPATLPDGDGVDDYSVLTWFGDNAVWDRLYASKRVSEVITLTSQDIENKYVPFSQTPSEEPAVYVSIEGGVVQIEGDDYQLIEGEVHWEGKGMETLLKEGDRLIIHYNINRVLDGG